MIRPLFDSATSTNVIMDIKGKQENKGHNWNWTAWLVV